MKRLTKKVARGVMRAVDGIQKRLFRAIGGNRYVQSLRSGAGSPPAFSGRMVVDLSVISQHDAGTGIQRVVRAIAFHLADSRAETPFPILFVASRGRRHYCLDIVDGRYIATNNAVELAAGDLFLGLDFSLDSLWRMRRPLADMRRRGVRFWYLVHDFLPITEQQWFSGATVLRFSNWLAIMAGTADGFFCVSQPVAKQLPAILKARFGITDCPPVLVIPMGSDLAGSQPSRGLPDGFQSLLAKMAAAPTLVQVGTIEPRKGHADSLAAMELLWQQGSPLQLVLVGDRGWKMDAFIERLRTHPQFGRRLFWTGRISDEALDLVYGACAGTIFPSLAEGFGLPVVEALAHGRAVMARRLEVLEPLEGCGVTLFDAAASPAELARRISLWFDGLARGSAPDPTTRTSWRDAADFMLNQLADQRIERK